MHADIPIVGDCVDVLGQLLDQFVHTPVDAARLSAWWSRIETWRQQQSLAFDDTAQSIAPQALMCCLQQQLEDRDAIVSTDVGQHQMWAAQHLISLEDGLILVDLEPWGLDCLMRWALN